MKRHIPNFITSLNLASGFIAAIYALNNNLVTASWLILAAMVFDFLDGMSARILKAYSDIGKELDSLADIVSFGVAPALLICRLIEIQPSSETFPFLPFIPAIMPVCAALRLAKFNTDPSQSRSFKGLPTPANALAVISVVIASHYSGSEFLNTLTGSVAFLLILTVVLSLLMVTRLPLLSLKTDHCKLKGNEGRYILILMVVVSFALFGISAAPLIIPLYITASLISPLLGKNTM